MELQSRLKSTFKWPIGTNSGLAEFKRPVCLRCIGRRHITCHICGGTGKGKANSNSMYIISNATCARCLGTGQERCPICHGIGVTVSG